MMKYPFFFSGQYRFNSCIGLFWGVGFHDSYTIHHTMDVCVDTHIGHVVEDREDDFGCLDANTWKSLQECEIIRDDSILFFRETNSSCLDIARLIAEEVHILQISLDLFDGYIDNIASFANMSKKWGRYPVDLFICCLG